MFQQKQMKTERQNSGKTWNMKIEPVRISYEDCIRKSKTKPGRKKKKTSGTVQNTIKK